GDTIEGGEKDNRTPPYGSPKQQMAAPRVWGVTAPWSLIVSAALGVWLMFAPAVFGTQGIAADSDHLVGALIVTFAVIAMGEVIRAARFINILFGGWLILAPWLLTGAGASAKWNGVIAGVILIILSLPRGTVRERYGSWNTYIV
ncbi:MAG: SPW repeat domain-containing protein, partial [Candidatus Binatia bacterium]